jgi:hypothetical protein
VAHEALVDLQRAGREVLQIQQRRVAGAEVVEREADAEPGALAHDPRHVFEVGEGARLQDFDVEPLGRDRRMGLQARCQALHEVGLLQVIGADVHADRQPHAESAPVLHLAERGVDHPIAKFDAERVVLDHGQERARRQQATLRVLPAQQRLGADDLTRAQVHLGLVVQHELPVVERAADFLQRFVAGAHGLIARRVVDVVAVLAGELCLVQRVVGLAQQLVGVGRLVLREERHAHAGRHTTLTGRQLHRFAGRGQQASQRRFDVGVGAQIAQHGHELVATNAGERVLLS